MSVGIGLVAWKKWSEEEWNRYRAREVELARINLQGASPKELLHSAQTVAQTLRYELPTDGSSSSALRSRSPSRRA